MKIEDHYPQGEPRFDNLDDAIAHSMRELTDALLADIGPGFAHQSKRGDEGTEISVTPHHPLQPGDHILIDDQPYTINDRTPNGYTIQPGWT